MCARKEGREVREGGREEKREGGEEKGRERGRGGREGGEENGRMGVSFIMYLHDPYLSCHKAYECRSQT